MHDHSEIFWILGAGRFGSLAVERLASRPGGPTMVAVDREACRLETLDLALVARVRADAIEFLLTREGNGSEWIVPAVPKHVAFRWLGRRLSRMATVSFLPVPQALDRQVPNPWRDHAGSLYTSFATFRCPDTCEEPEGRCSLTGRPRVADLFVLLENAEVPGHRLLVVRSHQLAPGVGGYRLRALWELLEQVQATEMPVLVATACRCHGVVHALRWHR